MTIAAMLILATAATPTGAKLPITGLAPGTLQSQLCAYHYRVSTLIDDCQRHCDQALAYHYSYVWMEAARHFETALTHDPRCAFAWMGLHKALEKWGKTAIPKPDALLALVGGAAKEKLPSRYVKAPKIFALEQAKVNLNQAGHAERLLITAKLQENSLWTDVKSGETKKAATATLDELLMLYEDDEEAWFARAQIADGTNANIPYYKALLRLNPLHPGANHELVHFFENTRRPALGWPYAEKYIASSPGLPHAFHMQAHLAMRIGKWDRTTDWSMRAIELEKAYHKAADVKPADDHQYQHHLETLTRSLVHDGRFDEARAVRKDAEANKYHFRPEWIRLAITAGDRVDAAKLIGDMRKTDKAAAAYYAALLALTEGDVSRAESELEVLRQSKPKASDKKAELRLWEVQGRVLCAKGDGAAGVKLLRRAVDKTKDDYAHHAWGNGASLMESWGLGALTAGQWPEAEEAFQEALAHDAGCVRAAMGLAVLCARDGRGEQAERFQKLARKCWARADAGLFERVESAIRALPPEKATAFKIPLSNK
jgi:tetratricopeptide (TPR) repeat protein